MEREAKIWITFMLIATAISLIILIFIQEGAMPCSWYDLQHINNTESRQVLETCWSYRK